MTDKPLVLIGCPCQMREDCISDYLKHIYELEYPKDRMIPAFFINNSTDKTEEIIKDFQQTHQDEYKDFKVWTGKVLKGKQDDQKRLTNRDYTLFSIVRNTFIKKIKSINFDYFFSVDSDVLIPPDSLNRLLSHGEDIMAALIYNGKDNKGVDFFNIFKWYNGDYRPFKRDYLDSTTEPFEVDITGACYLIDKKVLQAGVRYSFYRAGEDGGFCHSAKDKGFKLYCDPTVRPVHLLSGKMKPQRVENIMTMRV